jgi:cyclin-dependent kinase
MNSEHRIGALIKTGVYGKVFACSQKNGNKKLAVKIVPTNSRGVTNLTEIVIMQSLNSPHIVHSTHAYVGLRSSYLVMELADSNLHELITLNPERIQLAAMAGNLIAALTELHRHLLIHCDITSANILVYGSSLRLTDFSISVLQSSPTQKYNTIACAVNYRPPEVLMCKEWNSAIDIWSMGCVFHELATHRMLFEVHNQPDPERMLLSQIVQWRRQKYSDVMAINEFILLTNTPCRRITWDGVDPEFVRIAGLMLSFDAAKRPTAKELLAYPYFQVETKNMDTGSHTGCSKTGSVHTESILTASRHTESILTASRHTESILTASRHTDIPKSLIARYVGAMPPEHRHLKVGIENLSRHCPEIDAVTLRLDLAYWLVHRLTYGSPPLQHVTNKIDIIMKWESIICQKLNYNLLPLL